MHYFARHRALIVTCQAQLSVEQLSAFYYLTELAKPGFQVAHFNFCPFLTDYAGVAFYSGFGCRGGVSCVGLNRRHVTEGTLTEGTLTEGTLTEGTLPEGTLPKVVTQLDEFFCF